MHEPLPLTFGTPRTVPVLGSGPFPAFPTAHTAGCAACPLSATRTHIVDGIGPYRPDLLIVGEAPGAEEDRAGVPFVGNSGKLLRATLGELGIDPARCWFTNSVRCRPDGNRDPTADELTACRPWLVHEIAALRPHTILALGKVAQAQVAAALASLPEETPVPRSRAAWHPAYILRMRAKLDAWKDQLRAVVGLDPPSPAPEPPVVLERAPWLIKPWVAVDTETDEADDDSGGYSLGQTLVCFQVSDGTSTALYEPTDPGAAEILRHLRGRRVFVHNAKFDLPLLGIDPANTDAWDDTMLMAYVLREEQIGLKALALKHLAFPMRPIKSVIGTGKKRMPFSEALRTSPAATRKYALDDALATARLAELFTYQLADDPVLLDYYEQIEKPILGILMAMEADGITVDPEALVTMGAILDDEIRNRTLEVQAALGVFNLASGPQLAQALLDIGIELTATTPTGRLATDETSLLAAVGVTASDDLDPSTHSHQVIKALLGVRSRTKLKTTYVTNLLEARDAGGRVHARFNQSVTNTNRLSSSGPNLQNIPVRGAIEKAMRRIFIAAPGRVLVKADYSQLEVRIYAHYTREPVLVDAYTHTDHDTRGPTASCLRCDVHQQVADALGIARSRAKNVLFGAIYGAAPPKLAATAGVPADQAVTFLGSMRTRVPSLLTWQTQCAGMLSRQGYQETLLGWRGYFPAYWSPVERDRRSATREAANFPIQGTAAGLVKRLMILVNDSVLPYCGARLLLQVHDEVVYEVPAEEARVFAYDLETLGAAVGEVSGMSVPLKLDVGIGPTWGDLTDWRHWTPA